MEHLPLPQGATIEPTERAPYIAEQYDGDDFMSWPQESRFKRIYDIFIVDGRPTTVVIQPEDDDILKDIDIFCQTWLSFGLIDGFFGHMTSSEAFIDRTVNPPCITTAELPKAVDRWLEHANRLRASTLDHLGQCVELSSVMLFQLSKQDLKVDKRGLLAIASVGETLEHVLRHVVDANQVTPRNWAMWWHELRGFFNLDLVPDSDQPLQLHGNYFGKPWLGLMTMWHADKMLAARKQKIFKMHNEGLLPDISPESTVYKHRCASKNCAMTKVDVAKVQQILEDGGIAVIDIDRKEGNVVVNVVPAESQQYHAVSHVWKEGLGNPSANELPECQLEDVLAADESVSPGHRLPIWLDTLCCPVSQMRHKHMCLTRMRNIYSGARSVLILDPFISQLSTKEVDNVEICAQIACSHWSRRLWTLKEGALAKTLHIRLKDTVLDVDDIIRDLISQYENQPIKRVVHFSIMTTVLDIRTLLRNQPTTAKPVDIFDVTEALDGRAVTVDGDETLCLSTCLDLDPAEILAASDHQRMPAFWKSFSSAGRPIPRSIIFFYGQRLSIPGYGWSPTSFLSAKYRCKCPVRASMDSEIAVLKHDGLHVRYPGCRLQMVEKVDSARKEWFDLTFSWPSISNAMVFRAKIGRWFMLQHDPNLSEELAPWLLTTLSNLGPNGAMILDRKLEAVPLDQASCALLVSSFVRDGKCYHKAHHFANIERLRTGLELIWETAWQMISGTSFMNECAGLVQLVCKTQASTDTSIMARNIGMHNLWVTCLRYTDDPALGAGLMLESHEELATYIMKSALTIIDGRCAEVVEDFPAEQAWCLE